MKTLAKATTRRLMAAVLVVCAGLWQTGCSSWIDHDLNVDPNNPQNVSLNLILPSVEGTLAYNYGSDVSRISSCWTQQHLGANRQHEGFYLYTITESDVNNAWNNMYGTTMINCDIMIKKATAEGSPAYAAVGKILQAISLGIVTDMWGDVPYSEAFGGEGVLYPKTDTQQEVYNTINALLDDAIATINNSSVNKPGADDLIYGGDLGKWTKAAWSLKARYAIHTTKPNGLKASTDALAALAKGFASNADGMILKFGASETNANPLYSFISSRTGDIALGPKLIELLNAKNDPRRMMIGDGLKSTDMIADTTPFGAFHTSPESPQVLCSYAELKFIEAEAKFNTGDKPGAKAAYLAGIAANMDWYGVSAADQKTYTDQASVTPSGDITLQQIMEQKYIALYTQQESYTDYRRTSYPTLTPTTAGKTVPVRFPTAQNQRLYNGKNLPAGATDANWINTPMWWNK
jgi:hypothetical protein